MTEQNETQTVTETTATEAPAPKRVKQIIYQDAEGNEIGRKDKGRGRNPKGATELPNGDIVVKGATLNDAGDPELPKVAVDRIPVDKIDLDAEGNVVARVAKGKGRAPKGYDKMEDGPYKGHWVKQHAAEAEAEQTEAPAEATAEVAPEQAEEKVEAIEADAETVAAAADADADEWEEVA